MSVPNKTILVAPDATGNPLALNTIGAIDYPVTLIAESDGHIIGTRPEYFAYYTPATNAPSRVVAELFNAQAQPVRVRGIWILPTQTNIATAIQIQFTLRRTSTVGTGGTTITPRRLDENYAALSASITARFSATGGGTTVYDYFDNFSWLDETSLGIQLQPYVNLLPVLGDRCIEIVLRNGQGLRITQSAAAVTTGLTGALLYFVVDN